MTITVTIEFEAAAGARDALVAKMQEIIPETLGFEGCQRIEFFERAETSGTLMLLEDWASAEHYDTYKAWRRETGTSVLGSDLVHGIAETITWQRL